MAKLSDNWPTITDDTGTKTDGTVINKSLFDNISTAITTAYESSTNPTVSAADIIDEVVTARGSLGALDTRLDVALNEDGTLKTQASLATLAQLKQTVGANNLVINDDFVIWAAGDSAAPTAWALTNLSAARAGTGLGDTTRKVGDFSVKLTRSGTDGWLYQDVVNSSEWTRCDFLEGLDVSIGAWVKSSTASAARVGINDNVATTASSYHTGGGSWEWLTATRTIDSSAGFLRPQLMIHNTDSDAYFSGVTVVLGGVPPSRWHPCPKIYGTLTFRKGGTLAVADGIDMFSFSRPAIVKDFAFRVATAPTGAAINFDVEQHNTSAYVSMCSTAPTITATNKQGTEVPDGTYSARCFEGGEGGTATRNLIRLNIDQVGSSAAGADLWFWIRAMQYVRIMESLMEHDHFGA